MSTPSATSSSRTPRERHPQPVGVEPPPRHRRGTGADADAHGVFHGGARSRRPLRRRLRHERRHACPGRHRHAGARQCNGGKRRQVSRRLPAAHAGGGRRAGHQRSVGWHGPPQRLHRGHAGVRWPTASRVVRGDEPHRGRGRARLRPGRRRALRGGLAHSDHEALRSWRARCIPAAHRRRQCARPAGRRRRSALARRLQPQRRRAAPRHAARVRPRRSRHRRTVDRRRLAASDGGADSRGAERRLPPDDGRRRLRRTGAPRLRLDRRRPRHRRGLRRQLRALPLRHQRAAQLHRGIRLLRRALRGRQRRAQQRRFAGAGDRARPAR